MILTSEDTGLDGDFFSGKDTTLEAAVDNDIIEFAHLSSIAHNEKQLWDDESRRQFDKNLAEMKSKLSCKPMNQISNLVCLTLS